ncbi:P1 family peptidase [Corynebacterium canis]|uniref:P1 family peptidase n=1 Tax=Corynebacterium canis TaxID=679663 RepID=A0A5C5UGT0_9CORY|nr:P1 family peptidase [Corynebacterium canis]TWT25027.1 P1 family peptidase [Corynebacterium canis]WJY76092.1 Peptidase family S58 [Corynebacterium canis]
MAQRYLSDAGYLSDVPGLHVGHTSLGDTGVSVIVAPQGATAAVDVRGGGPGTRETDLLEPHNTVQQVHAITLSGGSAYGLATADGVMAELERRGIGFPVINDIIVPIVPAAVIFDLLVGDPQHRPTADDGRRAVIAALDAPSQNHAAQPESGNVGAGCGATAGALRGGFGQASVKVGEFVVAAGVVANPVGAVIDARDGSLWATHDIPPVDLAAFAELRPLATKLNTTIGVVATDAPVSKQQAKRLAMVAHDGLARAIRPAHSPLDGDTLFALSTGEPRGVQLEDMVQLSSAAAEVVHTAIIDAVTSASPGYGLTCYRDIALEANT